MKVNSLEELVTNSNIAGELRNYTDWHTRLVKFAQLVADWQKQRIMEDAVEVTVKEDAGGYPYIDMDIPLAKRGDKVRIIIMKEEEEK